MKNTGWLSRPVKDLTLEDCMTAYEYGIILICGDGRLRDVTSSPATRLVNILRREELKYE